MQLSRNNLEKISSKTVTKPKDEIFELPEKVLQFGTGVLLRGLPDYFIDKANQQGVFNGRVVMVKSTSSGDVDGFAKQNNLYTVSVRGIEGKKKIEEFIINSSISRVISANEDWDKVLDCAKNPELKIIISNTTEVGITLVEDDIRLSPPHSFPGKMLAFLYERYKTFKGKADTGFVIIPTELIIDNGKKLKTIVLQLAKLNKLEENFIEWLNHSNEFCNSLVDRIVPGKLSGNDKQAAEKKLGYTDDLMIMAESFRLWAIESGKESVREILSFAKVDDGVVIAPDIEKFRELKLRLLNGTHTFSCGLAHLAGFGAVREAMDNSHMSSYIRNLAFNEIVPAISNEKISSREAANFANSVMDRFKNPFLDHAWINITVQYSSKMKMRNVPLLLKHYQKSSTPPEQMVLGFAAFLLFMKCSRSPKGKYCSHVHGKQYEVQDDDASYFADKWANYNETEISGEILSDKKFWGVDLSALPGFAEAVKCDLLLLTKNAVMPTIRRIQLSKQVI